MNIISKETKTSLGIKYTPIINKVIEGTLDYLEFPYDCEVSVTIVDSEAIKEINKEFREIDKPTDVLSFPLNEPHTYEEFNYETGELMLGDIVLNADRIISQAKEYGHSRQRELAFLTCHSVLHLVGYDHMKDEEREEMEDLQRKILDKLGYTR